MCFSIQIELFPLISRVDIDCSLPKSGIICILRLHECVVGDRDLPLNVVDSSGLECNMNCINSEIRVDKDFPV